VLISRSETDVIPRSAKRRSPAAISFACVAAARSDGRSARATALPSRRRRLAVSVLMHPHYAAARGFSAPLHLVESRPLKRHRRYPTTPLQQCEGLRLLKHRRRM
jgi:hypothetical protein